MGARSEAVTLLELVDALILFDSLMLDHRFQQAIHHHPSKEIQARLAKLPEALAEGARVTRRAAILWESVTGEAVDDEMVQKAEHFLLNAVLQAAEEQIRLKVFLARHAPTREVREILDHALEIHRVLTTTLRDALKELPVVEEPKPWSETRAVAAEHPSGDLRGQLEAQIRGLREKEIAPKVVHLSPTAVRHLRDQGLFRDGASTILEVPVMVELAWTGSEYAISTFESMPLDEIISKK